LIRALGGFDFSQLDWMQSESQYIWEPPTFDITEQPSLAHEAHLLPDPHFQENFARSAKWCVCDEESFFFFASLLFIDAPDSRLADDHSHGHQGVQTVHSLWHTVRIALCNILTCESYYRGLAAKG
jgi:hypothetical protein